MQSMNWWQRVCRDIPDGAELLSQKASLTHWMFFCSSTLLPFEIKAWVDNYWVLHHQPTHQCLHIPRLLPGQAGRAWKCSICGLQCTSSTMAVLATIFPRDFFKRDSSRHQNTKGTWLVETWSSSKFPYLNNYQVNELFYINKLLAQISCANFTGSRPKLLFKSALLWVMRSL